MQELHTNQKQNRGFTLIEALIAVAFFAIIMTVTADALLGIISNQQDISSEQALLDDVNSTLNTISVEVQESLELPGDCTEGCSEFRFKTRPRQDRPARWVTYRLNDTTGRIEKAAQTQSGPCATTDSFPSQCFQPLTDENITINEFLVYVENPNETNMDPIVTPSISGIIETQAGVNESINLTTSVSPRRDLAINTNSSSCSPPSAAITYTEGSGSGDSLSFNFDGSGSTNPEGDSETYAWDFGDGNTGTGETTSHTYSNPYKYTVTLTVSNGCGDDDDTVIVYPGCGLAVDKNSVTVDESIGIIDWDMWNTCKNQTITFDDSLSIYATDQGANANAIGWVDGFDYNTEFQHAGGYADIKDVDSTCGDHAYCLGNTFTVGTLPNDQTQDGSISSNSSEDFRVGAWYPDTATDSGDYLEFPDAEDEVSIEYQNITNLPNPVEFILAPSGTSTQNTYGN